MADSDSRAGLRYADPDIVAFCDGVHVGADAASRDAFDAPDKEKMPAIMVGLSEGRLLGLLARMVGAERIVEVGTLAGFSAIELAGGMGESGHLWTIEHEPRHAAVARKNIAGAGMTNRITVVDGDGVEELAGLEAHGPFDVVFVDADKARYDQYGRWARAHLRPGGILLMDNAYLFGRLLDDGPAPAAMRRAHEEAAAHLHSVCIPTPDGLILAIMPTPR